MICLARMTWLSLLTWILTLSVIEAASVDWAKDAQEVLNKAMNTQTTPDTGVAKNVIIFVGDGMGISTITAARIFKGQQAGRSGEEEKLSFEQFPHLALSKTYNVDHQVPDSAGTATALFTGVKTNFGLIGVNEKVKPMDCDSVSGNEATSILKWSQDAGKSTGVVTTTRITHATPAATYAHAPWRFWETDSSVPTGVACKDIARQLIEDNLDINVILGGGRQMFLPNDTSIPDPEYPDQTGLRADGRDLTQEWVDYHKQQASSHQYVWNATAFNNVDTQDTDYLLGLFEPSHMQYELDRLQDPAGEPSLTQMTEKAIRILSKNTQGFFLMVEGGRIDHAHHEANAKRSLADTVALSDAVQRALELTDPEETLIVVTADHSHTFTIGGYPARGNNILGLVPDNVFITRYDENPFTTLMYANGPGLIDRSVLRDQDTTADDFLQPVAVPLKYETHGGEDVAIFAHGPMAHLFHGVREQNYVAHAAAYASCVGSNVAHCSHTRGRTRATTGNTAPGLTAGFWSVGLVASVMIWRNW